MKKLSAIISLLVIAGLFHQGVVFAGATKEKKPTKTNFTAKKKHGGEAVVSKSKKATASVPAAAPAPAPVVAPPPPPPPPVFAAPAPAASPSPEASPAV